MVPESAASASAHLVIGHDGAITQMAPFDTVTWHAGRSRWKNVNGLNSHSVGIEIVNWGKLKRSGGGGWLGWTGNAIPDARVMMAAHQHSPGVIEGWEVFDAAQYEATVLAAKAIVEAYGIGQTDLVGHDDISPGRKVDPGPAFDMDVFRNMVFGRSDDVTNDLVYKVASDNGLNLRMTPSTEHPPIKSLPNGTKVHVIEKPGRWWFVAEIVGGKEDATGFVHSNWLQPVA